MVNIFHLNHWNKLTNQCGIASVGSGSRRVIAMDIR